MAEVVNRNAFPSNSHKTEKPQAPEKDIRQVVDVSRVKRRKKPLVSRAASAILADQDVKDVKNYVLVDVLIPAIRDGIWAIISGGLEMMLYGENRRSRRTGSIGGYPTRPSGATMISYNDISARRLADQGRKSRSTHQFDDIVFDSKAEAEEVLSDLVDTIAEYQFASVEDFYRMCGLPTNPVDRNWGWNNLSKADTRRVSDGYIISLPPTIEYD